MVKMWWKPEMVRAIFDAIEEQQGPESKFIDTYDTAIEEVVQRVKKITTDEIVSKGLDRAKIVDKISKQARKGGLAADEMPKLYEHGPNVLNLANLSAGVYSADEIKERNNRKAQIPSKKAVKPRIDHIQADKTIVHEYIPSQKRKTSAAEGQHDTIEVSKVARNETGSFSTNRSRQHASAAGEREAQESGEFVCEQCKQIFTQKATLDEHKHDVHLGWLPKNLTLCSVQGCGAYFGYKDELERHLTDHAERQSMHQLWEAARSNAADTPSNVPENDKAAKSDGQNLLHRIFDGNEPSTGEMRLLKSMRHGRIPDHMDVDKIRKKMQRIQRDIFSHTIDFFDKKGYDMRAAPCGTLKDYEKPLIDLLSSMIRLDAHKTMLLRDSEHASAESIQVFDLVMALIAAAVTRWALHPLPQGKIGYGLFEHYTSIISSQSAAMHDEILEQATKAYLEGNVSPNIPINANEMGIEFVRLVKPIITGLSATKTFSRTTVPPSQADEEGIEQLEGQVNENIHWPQCSITSDPLSEFTQRLATDIFGAALELRSGMETRGYARYKFVLPLKGDRFDFDEHIALDASNNKEIQRAQLYREEGLEWNLQQQDSRILHRRIKAALFPKLEGSFKETIGGEWGPVVDLVHANVLLWQEPKKLVQEEEDGAQLDLLSSPHAHLRELEDDQ